MMRRHWQTRSAIVAVIVAVGVAAARIAATAAAVTGVLRHPMTNRTSIMVAPADLINRVNRGSATVIANNAAVIVTIIPGTGFHRGEETNTGYHSKKGDDFFHRSELEVRPFRRHASSPIQKRKTFFQRPSSIQSAPHIADIQGSVSLFVRHFTLSNRQRFGFRFTEGVSNFDNYRK